VEIIVELSARHVHLSAEHVEILFGKGAKLTVNRMISQPGQYLSNEKVNIIGSRSGINNVSVLGPERPATQVEISKTDARALGADPPLRESGDVAGSGAIRIEGPAGSIDIDEGVIVVKRHVHMTPEDAAEAGVADRQIVKMRVGGERALTFEEVVVRVSPKFALAMHIDIDEANAAVCTGKEKGELII